MHQFHPVAIVQARSGMGTALLAVAAHLHRHALATVAGELGQACDVAALGNFHDDRHLRIIDDLHQSAASSTHIPLKQGVAPQRP